MAFVSITRLRIRSFRFMPGFVLYALRSSRQCRRATGFLGGAVLGDRARAFWTMTLWRDEAAMRAYMTGGAHRAAMPKLMHWCDEASVVHWRQDADTLPDWTEADARMRGEGRPSKVRNPGPRHAGLAYAPPVRPARCPCHASDPAAPLPPVRVDGTRFATESTHFEGGLNGRSRTTSRRSDQR